MQSQQPSSSVRLHADTMQWLIFRKCQLNMFLLASVVLAESEDVKIQSACLTPAKVAAPCPEGCRSNFHRTKIGVAREFRSIRGRTECYAKGPIVRITRARMFDSFADLGCGGPVQFN